MHRGVILVAAQSVQFVSELERMHPDMEIILCEGLPAGGLELGKIVVDEFHVDHDSHRHPHRGKKKRKWR